MKSMNRKSLLFSALGGAPACRLSNGCKQRDSARRPNGFTLMELLIVMAIIAILMLIAIPTVAA